MTPEQQGIFTTGLLIGLLFGGLIAAWITLGIQSMVFFDEGSAYQQFSDLRSNPISLMDFAIAVRWSGKKAEKWLDGKIKEFGGIKDKQSSGDQWYYFGDAADKLMASYDKLIDTGALKQAPDFTPKKPIKYTRF